MQHRDQEIRWIHADPACGLLRAEGRSLSWDLGDVLPLTFIRGAQSLRRIQGEERGRGRERGGEREGERERKGEEREREREIGIE